MNKFFSYSSIILTIITILSGLKIFIGHFSKFEENISFLDKEI